MASVKNQHLVGLNHSYSVNYGNKSVNTASFHWEKGKKKPHHIDDRAVEKTEESDVKQSNTNDGLSFPLVADLLYKNIRFGLFSLLYNSKSAPLDVVLFTCYDSERFILLQHFRI
ncbi:hypothetical protein [Sphingobacterium paludis]|nr:hypothetical protein [Sphingobacterium paludis]